MQDPNQRLWLRFAGIARLELGDDQPAIGALQQAAALGPPAPPLRAALASAYALIGDRAQSREQFELLKQAADPVALEQLLAPPRLIKARGIGKDCASPRATRSEQEIFSSFLIAGAVACRKPRPFHAWLTPASRRPS